MRRMISSDIAMDCQRHLGANSIRVGIKLLRSTRSRGFRMGMAATRDDPRAQTQPLQQWAQQTIAGEKRMPTILGSGEHRYRVVENWAKLPDGWSLTDVASVAVDSKDRIYVFNRGAHPMVVLDRAGQFHHELGRRPVQPRARAAHRRRRQSLLHR